MTFRPAPTSGALTDGPADVMISEPVLVAQSFRRLERFTVDLRLDDGTVSHHDRDVLRVGRIAAALPVDPVRGEVVLIRQFRIAAHLATGLGELVEIVAGHVEAGEDSRTAAMREIEEEIGVTALSLHELYSFLPAPGINDELTTMYLAIVDATRVPERAGAEHESEATRPLRISVADAIAALDSGQIRNGYLILALQWLALHRDKIASYRP
jgi:ADP-ribose pyrophosphatase